MRTFPLLNARADAQGAYDYMRIPRSWDTWICRGVRYAWHGHQLIACDGELSWRFDLLRDQWVRSVERAA